MAIFPVSRTAASPGGALAGRVVVVTGAARGLGQRTRSSCGAKEPPSWPSTPDEASDPYSPVRVAPVVAWLVSDAARDITGRVGEVGGDRLAIAERWRPDKGPGLPVGTSVSDAGDRLRQLLVDAPPPRQPFRAGIASVDGLPGAAAIID